MTSVYTTVQIIKAAEPALGSGFLLISVGLRCLSTINVPRAVAPIPATIKSFFGFLGGVVYL